MDAVIIPEEYLPGTAGHDISNFRLLRVCNGTVSPIKVPEEFTDYIIINPWLVADPAVRYTPESVPGADPEVGFEIKTGEDFPSGKYVLHAIYKFSADAYKKEDAYNTSDLLHRALQYQVTPLK